MRIIEFDDSQRENGPGNGSRSNLVVGSKPSDEALRQGRNRTKQRRERGFCGWFARRAYREHPYFTTNLKYVC
jgi:hypothetical protein